MTLYLTELMPFDITFPPVESALNDPNGLLAFGGDLSPKRLLEAYRNGIFPWYGPGEPILWWSPAPRAIFWASEYSPSKSVKKYQRKIAYSISINQATHQVIDYCANTRTPDQTWLNDEMKMAYKTLADQGICHSVEVWDTHNELIGGLYGISIGQVFCGESMFSLESNASKIALWKFCEHFTQHQGKLIDCQVMNPHLASLGALELPRDEFIFQLNTLKNQPLKTDCFAPQWLERNDIT